MAERLEDAIKRWDMLREVQACYPTFIPFLHECMEILGFSTTRLQEDIAEFLQYGPAYLMIQAQRGQAKTTITAAYAVWCLIHNPQWRILIVSAGGKRAKEISTLIVRLIMHMPELECMRPDKAAGDLTSVEGFDIHHSLKGVEKSASVSSMGIDSNIQGARADLLIADDIESLKNSKTEHLREALTEITRDFSSICSTGRIVYLGTPQSINSIYNSLPGRGFTVRIWTGRFPTPEQMQNYGDMLAPYITRLVKANPKLQTGGGLLGDQGMPTDPQLPGGTEEFLQRKERDQGPSFFQLQHMLNTRLADAARYPLKTSSIISVRLAGETFPMTITPGLLDHERVKYEALGTTYYFNTASAYSAERAPLQGIIMHVDPAGGGKNGDETGYAIVGFLNSTCWVLECSGVAGGYRQDVYDYLAERAAMWKVNRITVEKNFGHGAFLNSWLPTLRAKYAKVGVPGGCAVEETWSSEQKEARIIETLEPVIARGSLVFSSAVIENEAESLMKYPVEQRSAYSLLHQIRFITRDRDSLKHDDRLDALAGAVRYWVTMLGIDQQKALEAKKREEVLKWQRNPLGHPATRNAPGMGRGASVFNKYRR